MNERLKEAGYAEQEGCETCAHVFIKHEHEEGPEHYCELAAGSLCPDRKEWSGMTSQELRLHNHDCHDWFAKHADCQVVPWGKCSKWEKNPRG